MMMINNAAVSVAVAAAEVALEHKPSTVQEVAAAGPSNPLVAPPNPRKKRTKLSRIEKPFAAAVAKTIVKRKPDPAAPKITRPCTECGKKFWSWKALFGHMRCHPERQWRGINPPPNLRNRPQQEQQGIAAAGRMPMMIMTEEDYEATETLLMLANSPMPSPSPSPAAAYFCSSRIPTMNIVGEDDSGEGLAAANAAIVLDGGNIDGDHNFRFECSCCRKVFTSHQALGGHRASHRNVKGCFAITTSSSSKNDGDPEGGEFNDEFNGAVLVELTRTGGGGGDNRNSFIGGEYSHHQHHKCGICSRVFTSGQALGGHKRCHWEKTMNNEALTPSSPSTSSAAAAAPPPLTPVPSSSYQQHPAGESSSSRVCLDCHIHHHHHDPNSHHYSLSSSTSSPPGLDLKLGL